MTDYWALQSRETLTCDNIVRQGDIILRELIKNEIWILCRFLCKHVQNPELTKAENEVMVFWGFRGERNEWELGNGPTWTG